MIFLVVAVIQSPNISSNFLFPTSLHIDLICILQILHYSFYIPVMALGPGSHVPYEGGCGRSPKASILYGLALSSTRR